MNILQINKFNYLKGGTERHLFELEELLVSKGHKVINFSMQDEKNKKSSYEKYFIRKIDLHKFNILNIFKYFYNYEAVRKLKKLIKKEKIDVAHLHNIVGQISPAIIKVLKKNNIKIIMTLHDYRLICPNAKLFCQGEICMKCRNGNYFNCLKNKCVHNSYLKSFLAMLEIYLNKKILKYYDLVDYFVAPSQYMKDISAEFGLSEKKIKVLYNFLNNIEFDDLKKNNEKYLLFFGRIAEEKGIDVLLDVMKDKNIDLNLKIAGKGTDFEKIKQKIRNENLSEKIKLLGFQEKNILKKTIANATAIVVPSIWPENMSYSLIESMLQGKVIIASDIGGISEVVENGKTGFVFKSGSRIELKLLIKRLKNINISLISKNAREFAKNNFNKEKYYKEIIDIYKK